jgi:hypothetical protein
MSEIPKPTPPKLSLYILKHEGKKFKQVLFRNGYHWDGEGIKKG